MKILTFSTLFPNSKQPNNAVFVKHRMAAVHRFFNAELRVVAPVPFFPNLPFHFVDKWKMFAEIPVKENIDGLTVYHPRYLVTPKVGMMLYGYFMFLGAIRQVARIHKEFPFDLIDAHYIYPDGLAAVLLGEVLRKPVVLSARGTDINIFPKFKTIRPLIRRALTKASHVIAVCESLRGSMINLGIPRNRISAIPNGIDPDIFRPASQLEARKKLGLNDDKKILISVGALVELKGMHILIDALTEINRMGRLEFNTYIIGKGEQKDNLQKTINLRGLQDKIKLCGEVRNSELPNWYNAADLFFLGSSREGWPNVVSESIACGTPVIATRVNGIPEILRSEEYGLLVNRDAQSFAEGIMAGFSKTWDQKKIVDYGQSRPWSVVAGEVYTLFQQVLEASHLTGGREPSMR